MTGLTRLPTGHLTRGQQGLCGSEQPVPLITGWLGGPHREAARTVNPTGPQGRYRRSTITSAGHVERRRVSLPRRRGHRSGISYGDKQPGMRRLWRPFGSA